MKLITAEKLILGYDGKKVTGELNFTVNKGDYLCVIGENGSGKTTLIKTLLGLNPKISGEIKKNFNKIGYLPQQTDAQRDFPASVWEIVLSGSLAHCGLKPFYTVKEKSKANEALQKMGIEQLKKRCYRELSGGQQQRVLLARALTATENVLLLDEPVTGLDPNATEELYSVIEALNKDGITVIMISHDIESAIKYATHILHIGDDIFFVTKEEYINTLAEGDSI